MSNKVEVLEVWTLDKWSPRDEEFLYNENPRNRSPGKVEILVSQGRCALDIQGSLECIRSLGMTQIQPYMIGIIMPTN